MTLVALVIDGPNAGRSIDLGNPMPGQQIRFPDSLSRRINVYELDRLGRLYFQFSEPLDRHSPRRNELREVTKYGGRIPLTEEWQPYFNIPTNKEAQMGSTSNATKSPKQLAEEKPLAERKPVLKAHFVLNSMPQKFTEKEVIEHAAKLLRLGQKEVAIFRVISDEATGVSLTSRGSSY